MPASTLTLNAHAKVNLALDITGRRADGYHLLDMINRSVSLYDTVELERAESGGVSIAIDGAPYIPSDERNLAVQAVTALADAAGVKDPAVKIRLKKRIPSQAGLGGGSADAAAVLVGLNRLWHLNYNEAELCAVGLTLGADVPFCITGGCARVGGIGEIVEPVDDRCSYSLLLAMENRGRSTRTMFAAYDSATDVQHPDIARVAAHLAEGDTGRMAMAVGNAFCSACPDEDINLLLAMLLKNKALGATMTGSGAAVFGVFANPLAAQRCCDSLRLKKMWACTVQPVPFGVDIISER